jgi:CBS domain-containing protein
MVSSGNGFSTNKDSNDFQTGIRMDELKVEYFMSKNPVTAHSNVNFPGAIDIMTTKGIGNLIVVENKEPIGIFTEREILYYLSQYGKLHTEKLLGDIELQSFCRVNMESTVLEAANKMILEKCRILVFDGDGVGDSVSIGDELKHNSSVTPGTAHAPPKIAGIITASDMIRAFSKQTEKDPPLESIVTRKIEYVDVNSTIYDAVKLMFKQNIGSVIVVDDFQEDIETKTGSNHMENRKLYGIFTERDLLTKILAKDVNLGERIEPYCSKEVITADKQVTGTVAASTMLMYKIKRLPLITRMVSEVEKPDTKTGTGTKILKGDNHKVEGIITARDLVELFQSR